VLSILAKNLSPGCFNMIIYPRSGNLKSFNPTRNIPYKEQMWQDHFCLEGTVLVTVETPSTNLVRNITLALLNIPSLRETTMNCTKNQIFSDDNLK
jgi:hypothetical protein